MGLNAIETYVPWNLHEPARGVFRFSGILDLARFLSIAHELDLLVLLRPGPYICSEWDFGGLPPFLLSDSTMLVRTVHRGFMKSVRRYFTALSRVIDPFIGRPVVGIQIENEYGRYVGDHAYMRLLVEGWNELGITRDRVVHFTSDNGDVDTVLDGSPFRSDTVLKTINFGAHVGAKMKVLKHIQPKAPPMVMEFWIGWYDHWGSNHHTRHADHIAKMLRDIVFNHDASVNVYMFMGGTNFGFMSGANLDDKHGFEPVTTSYDYDAFVTEFGHCHSFKFEAARTVLREFWAQLGDEKRLKAMDEPSPRPPFLSTYVGKIPLTASITMLNILNEISASNSHVQFPISIEAVGGDFGYVLYRHLLARPSEKGSYLELNSVRDVAYVMFDGVVAQRVQRKHPNDTTTEGLEAPTRISLSEGTKHIDILVENSGRVNYGMAIHDRKGLLGNVTLDDVPLEGFDMYLLSFPQDHPWIRNIDLRTSIDLAITAMHGRLAHPPMGESTSQPSLFHGLFEISRGLFEGKQPPSCFCQVYGRGTLWINGFNVGRFNTGTSHPQQSLFIPGSLLRVGSNDIVVFHIDMSLANEPPMVELFDHPDYGPVHPIP